MVQRNNQNAHSIKTPVRGLLRIPREQPVQPRRGFHASRLDRLAIPHRGIGGLPRDPPRAGLLQEERIITLGEAERRGRIAARRRAFEEAPRGNDVARCEELIAAADQHGDLRRRRTIGGMRGCRRGGHRLQRRDARSGGRGRGGRRRGGNRRWHGDGCGRRRGDGGSRCRRQGGNGWGQRCFRQNLLGGQRRRRARRLDHRQPFGGRRARRLGGHLLGRRRWRVRHGRLFGDKRRRLRRRGLLGGGRRGIGGREILGDGRRRLGCDDLLGSRRRRWRRQRFGRNRLAGRHGRQQGRRLACRHLFVLHHQRR